MKYAEALDMAGRVLDDWDYFPDVGQVGVVGDEGADNWRVVVVHADDEPGMIEDFAADLYDAVEVPLPNGG